MLIRQGESVGEDTSGSKECIVSPATRYGSGQFFHITAGSINDSHCFPPNDRNDRKQRFPRKSLTRESVQKVWGILVIWVIWVISPLA